MKRSILAAVAACALAAPLATPAQASPAREVDLLGSPLHFTFIQYDSPGNDLPPTNVKLNAEFVTIANPTSTPRVMTGWHVHDADGHRYTFTKFTLGPNKSVRLHTGRGTNTAANRYWGQGYYVWTNDGDTAFLAGPAGAVVDTCKWGSLGSGSIHC